MKKIMLTFFKVVPLEFTKAYNFFCLFCCVSLFFQNEFNELRHRTMESFRNNSLTDLKRRLDRATYCFRT